MTAPTASQPQVDMGRVAQLAAQAGASPVADLALQVAMIQASAEVHAGRAAELEKQLQEKTAELARAQQTVELLQRQIQESESGGEIPTAPTGEQEERAGAADEPPPTT